VGTGQERGGVTSDKEKEDGAVNRLVVSVLAIAVLALCVVAESIAQGGMRWRGSGGWGPGGQYGRMYDPKTVETINGRVISVEKMTPRAGMSYGVHATLQSEKETISVHLGPGWYIENQDVKILPQDMIEVKGSRVALAGKPAIIAAEVKKADDLLKLRDEAGFPVWAGWRKRPVK
jgi:hypothetical protein